MEIWVIKYDNFEHGFLAYYFMKVSQISYTVNLQTLLEGSVSPNSDLCLC